MIKKVLLSFIAVLFISIVILAVFYKPVLLFYVTKEIKKELGADRVSVKDCDLKFLYFIEFKGIAIHLHQDIDINASNLSVKFDPWMIMRGDSLDQAIRELDVSDFNIQSNAFRLDRGQLNINREAPGFFSIDRVKFQKLVIAQITSHVLIRQKELVFKDISGKLLNGDLKGDLQLTLQQDPRYAAKIHFYQLDMSDVTRTFDLKEKTALEGLISGPLILQGQGASLKVLKGALLSGRPGGSVIIKDAKFIEGLVGRSMESSELLVESLKNYHYNDGNINLTLDQGVVLLEVNLNGDSGKRHFEIRLHNFI